ncbi:hypothetical protein AJ80_07077 [Polytolypa hystricis UAMH7299]|uniref:BTB domain-containing protein n=1 Tax=Polytolypa hystricis (strain UAMH7299) TaxID=1447883 RepID=A0A2B7XRW9_POLH7|nr:hypothetical protein AJ80_07077 [Polytolypa hystricis UAMH7299]
MPRAAGSSAQYQPITTTLRNILKDYPPQTCLRELLQNADDSGATEVEFVLDTSQNACDKSMLIDPFLIGYQGPALLARNNRPFTLEDISSLCKVGDSGKLDDATVTGKFGRGFNSVYHWTDGPSIYSENRLVFQDPHRFWSDGGAYYMTTEDLDDEEDPQCRHAKTHLDAFKCFRFDPSLPYEGTIIRIPLRTEEQANITKIGEPNKSIDVDEIRRFLEEFAVELSDAGLLFLKNIMSVVIRVDEEVISRTEILDANGSVTTARKELIRHMGKREEFSVGFEVDIQHAVNDEEPQVTRYAVQHQFSNPPPDDTLVTWAARNKLFPWVAVAASVSSFSNSRRGPKPLFSTLRLRQMVEQPVYLHGLWAITPDRDHLAFSPEAERWNNFMFEKVVTAWLRILSSRAKSSPAEEKFSLWPGHINSATDPTSSIHDILVDQAIQQGLPIWNSYETCVGFQDALFDRESARHGKYGSHFAAVGVPVVYLPEDVFDRATHSPQMRLLTPSAVVDFLISSNKALETVGPKTRLGLLEYCLPSNQFAQLGSLPLWPAMDGTFIILGITVTFLPRDINELNLFAFAQPSETIDIRCLAGSVLSHFNAHQSQLYSETFLRFRRIDDLANDWPMLYALPTPEENTLYPVRMEEYENVLIQIWKWIYERREKSGVHAAQAQISVLPDDLHIVPIRGGRIRKLRPGNQAPATLLVRSENPLVNLLNRIADSAPGSVTLLDTEALQPEGVQFVGWCMLSMPSVRIYDANSVSGLLDFLTRARNHLYGLPTDDVEDIWARITSLAESLSYKADTLEIAKKLRLLPIFPLAIGTLEQRARKSEIQVEWSHLDPTETYISIGDLPAVPQHDGVRFVHLKNADMKRSAVKFGLVQVLSTEDLFEQYVVPAIEQKTTASSSTKRLLSHVLKCSPILSPTWKTKLGKFPIIRTQSGDGCGKGTKPIEELFDPTARCFNDLFFPDEEVFPVNNIFDENKSLFWECGLRKELTSNIILDRIKYYSDCDAEPEDLIALVNCLVAQCTLKTKDLQDRSLLRQIQSIKWLPAHRGDTLALLEPNMCRPQEDAKLVGHVLSLTDLDVSSGWRKVLGWDTSIDIKVLLDQLRASLELKTGLPEVQAVLRYLNLWHDPDAFIPTLRNLKCIPGRDELLYSPNSIFSTCGPRVSSLSPYLGVLDEKSVPVSLVKDLNIKELPSLHDLLNVQKQLVSSGSPLSARDLTVALAVLDLASIYPTESLVELMGPDERCFLVNIAELTQRPSSKAYLGTSANIRFAHRRISIETLERLDISTAQDRDFNDDDAFEPYEDLVTVIEDCISRYPIGSTFTEFLANAEDSGASKICWIVDSRPDPADCANKDLQDVMVPALSVYNNRVFTEKDFNGLLHVGIGSKRSDEISIGSYGRGVLTMYHFTDTPMIVSGSTFLILDPLGTCLPRRGTKGANRRFTGLKLSLSRARHRFGDLLSLFNGIFGYSSDLDEFEGTIFRFPLRKANRSGPSIDGTKTLALNDVQKCLDTYSETAKISLLFLSEIKLIDCRIIGQTHTGRVWAVTADRKPVQDSSMIEVSVRHRVKLGSTEYRATQWLVAISNEEPPPNILVPKRKKKKLITFGVAAPRKLTPSQNHSIFCGLPTKFSSGLPVSVHATFALSSDRREIPFDKFSRSDEVAWNKWLVSDCLPKFYLKFLEEAHQVYTWRILSLWPSHKVKNNEISQAVVDGFWNLFQKEESRDVPIFPCAIRTSGHCFVSMKDAWFDFLPDRNASALRSFLSNFYPGLVRLPSHLRESFTATIPQDEYKTVNSSALCSLFKHEDHCIILERTLNEYKAQKPGSEIEFWNHLLACMIPEGKYESIEEMDELAALLDGCRVLPLLNGKLGRLCKVAPNLSTTWCLLGKEKETELFSFASDLLVDGSFLHVQDSLGRFSAGRFSVTFNIRPITLDDIGTLLAHDGCPVKSVSTDSKAWLQRLWSTYLSTELRLQHAAIERDRKVKAKRILQKVLQEHGLLSSPIYLAEDEGVERFISHETFKVEGIVKPDNQQEASMCSKLPMLLLISPDYAPQYLRIEEPNLHSVKSFRRFLKCLMNIDGKSPGGIELFLRMHLKLDEFKVLRETVFRFLCKKIKPLDLAFLRKFPLLPYVGRTDSGKVTKMITAQDAKLCWESMLHPWVTDREKWVSVQPSANDLTPLRHLGLTPVSIDKIWGATCKDLPPPGTLLSDDLLQKYYRFLHELRTLKLKFSFHPIAVNRIGRLCIPNTLFEASDPLFVAAFRKDPTKFLHPTVSPALLNWQKVGLRHWNRFSHISPLDYTACIQAMKDRLPDFLDGNDSDFLSDCAVVTQVVNVASNYSNNVERALSLAVEKAELFETMAAPNDIVYRRQRMKELVDEQLTLSPSLAGRKKFMSISWSQAPFLKLEPNEYVYQHYASNGHPSVDALLDHLQFLVAIRESVPENEISLYLRDIQDTYSALQEYYSSQFSPSHGLRTLDVWFNFETADVDMISKQDLEGSLLSADRLCFRCPIDPEPLKYVRPFLTPYEKLLTALGCQIVKQPPLQLMNNPDGNISFAEGTIAAINDFRDSGSFFDIELRALDKNGIERTIPAHSLILVASSKFFKEHYKKEWKKDSILLEEISFEILSLVVDFLYRGLVTLPTVSSAENTEAIADKLDHCLDLLHAAHFLVIPRLHNTVETSILKHAGEFIRPDNVRELLSIAEAYESTRFKDHCIQFQTMNEGIVDRCEQLGEESISKVE